MRKNLVHRLLAAACVTALVAGSLAGCSGSSSSSSSTDSTSTETAEESSSTEETTVEETAEESGVVTKDSVDKPSKITWWTHDGLNEEDYVAEWNAAYEELTGITLEHTQVSNNEYAELLELAFASGTEPNVFDLSTDQRLAYYASQGACADLTDLLKESGLWDRVDEEIWEAIAIDGRIYGIPTELASGILNYVRGDWLEELGMDIPTTYDEYIEMLRAFRDEIDECTIPLTAPGLSNAQNLPEFYWDAEADFTYKDGQWVDGMLEDNFADAMQRLADAYAEGLIDTEVVTNTTSNCRDKWYSGTVGVFSYWYGKWGNTLNERLQENFPDAYLVGIPSIEETYYRYSNFNVKCIDGTLSDDEIRSIFYWWFGTIFDGSEGQALYYMGVEGLHSTVNENGQYEYLEMASSPGNVFASVWGSPGSSPFSWDDPSILPDLAEMNQVTMDTFKAEGVVPTTTPVSETLNAVTADLSAIREELIANMVMGVISVEEGMESYRQQAEALGVEQILAELNGN